MEPAPDREAWPGEPERDRARRRPRSAMCTGTSGARRRRLPGRGCAPRRARSSRASRGRSPPRCPRRRAARRPSAVARRRGARSDQAVGAREALDREEISAASLDRRLAIDVDGSMDERVPALPHRRVGSRPRREHEGGVRTSERRGELERGRGAPGAPRSRRRTGVAGSTGPAPADAGRTPRSIASAHASSSSAEPAPSVWPIWALNACTTASRARTGPRTAAIARASDASLKGVAVAWAPTRSTSGHPASESAARAARARPALPRSWARSGERHPWWPRRPSGRPSRPRGGRSRARGRQLPRRAPSRPARREGTRRGRCGDRGAQRLEPRRDEDGDLVEPARQDQVTIPSREPAHRHTHGERGRRARAEEENAGVEGQAEAARGAGGRPAVRRRPASRDGLPRAIAANARSARIPPEDVPEHEADTPPAPPRRDPRPAPGHQRGRRSGVARSSLRCTRPGRANGRASEGRAPRRGKTSLPSRECRSRRRRSPPPALLRARRSPRTRRRRRGPRSCSPLACSARGRPGSRRHRGRAAAHRPEARRPPETGGVVDVLRLVSRRGSMEARHSSTCPVRLGGAPGRSEQTLSAGARLHADLGAAVVQGPTASRPGASALRRRSSGADGVHHQKSPGGRAGFRRPAVEAGRSRRNGHRGPDVARPTRRERWPAPPNGSSEPRRLRCHGRSHRARSPSRQRGRASRSAAPPSTVPPGEDRAAVRAARAERCSSPGSTAATAATAAERARRRRGDRGDSQRTRLARSAGRPFDPRVGHLSFCTEGDRHAAAPGEADHEGLADRPLG